MRRLQFISFEFENCERFTIEAKYIACCHIEEISREITSLACYTIYEMEVAHSISMMILRDADASYECWGEKNESKLRRIADYNDITSLILFFDDNSELQLFTDYNTPNDQAEVLGAENINQHSMVSDAGDLYLVIDSKKTLQDAFSEEAFDRDVVEFCRDLIGKGND